MYMKNNIFIKEVDKKWKKVWKFTENCNKWE